MLETIRIAEDALDQRSENEGDALATSPSYGKRCGEQEQTNAETTAALIPLIAEAQNSGESPPSKSSIPDVASSLIASCVGENHVGGKDLRILALRAGDALWAEFQESTIVPHARRGKVSLKCRSEVVETYFRDFDGSEFVALAQRHGVQVIESHGFEDLPGGTLSWEHNVELSEIAKRAADHFWNRFHDAVLVPLASKGKLFLQAECRIMRSHFPDFTPADVMELAQRNGVTIAGEWEGGLYDDLSGGTLTWDRDNKLFEIAMQAADDLWTQFQVDVLLPQAKKGKLFWKGDGRVLKTHFLGFDGSEFTALAKRHDVTVTGPCKGNIYDDLSSGVLTFDEKSTLSAAAVDAADTLWSSFRMNVLLPQAKRGKLSMKVACQVMVSHFPDFDGSEVTTLAQRHNVVVTGSSRGKINDDLSGGTLTWKEDKELLETATFAADEMWSQFYEKVLLPLALKGKLIWRCEQAVLQRYFPDLDAQEFTTLAEKHDVFVTGRMYGDLCGGTLTW